MIQDVKLSKEISVLVANKIGILADISKIAADHGLNIEAVAGYAGKDNEAKIMLVASDNLRASDALKKAGYTNLRESDVVVIDLENKPGALKSVTNKLAAENIDIKYIYGTACAQGCPAKIVLSTSDNKKALVLFKK